MNIRESSRALPGKATGLSSCAMLCLTGCKACRCAWPYCQWHVVLWGQQGKDPCPTVPPVASWASGLRGLVFRALPGKTDQKVRRGQHQQVIEQLCELSPLGPFWRIPACLLRPGMELQRSKPSEWNQYCMVLLQCIEVARAQSLP